MNRSRVTGDLASHGNIFVDIANDRVGIGSTIPGQKLSLPDSAKIALGNSADLQLFHDGSNSFISDTGSGALRIVGSQLLVRNAADNENMIVASQNGAVELYYDNSKKLETTGYGINITAHSDIRFTNGNWTGDITNAKIQLYNNILYLAGGTEGIMLREGSTDRWRMDPDGNFDPATDSAYDIGQSNLRVRVGYFDDITVEDINVGDDITAGGELNLIGSSDAAKYIDARVGTSNSLNFRSTSGGDTNHVTMMSLNTSGASIIGDLSLGDGTADSAAGPEFKLNRNSASPADNDYLGQIKFAGRSSTGVERDYAKITGKILDVTNGTEDGILEFTHIKAGSQVITGRWRSDSLQLLNGTNLSVDGTSTFESDVTIQCTGDANLNLVADTGNNNEASVPTINFTQDGGVNVMKIGVEGTGGETFTGSTSNTPYLITTTGHGGMSLDFGTNNALRMKLTTSALQPAADSTYDLGTNTIRWRRLYVDGIYDANTERLKVTNSGFEAVGTQFKFSDTADTNVIINADTDNNNEAHHASLSFKQDGTVHVMDIGVNGTTADYTGATHNFGYVRIGGHGSVGLEIATSGSAGNAPTKRLTIDHNGHITPGADSSYDIGSNSVRFRNLYADTLYGDGSNLTSLPAQATIANNADNRVITGGSGVNLNGESALTFSGQTLSVYGAAGDPGRIDIKEGGAVSRIMTTRNSDTNGDLRFFTEVGGSLAVRAKINYSGDFEIPDKIVHEGDTNTAIRFPAADTITFETTGGERLRIDGNGNIGINCTPVSSGTLYNTVDHFLVIGDNDTGIAQDGDGQFEIWANNAEIANFNTSGVTFTTGITAGSSSRINADLGINVTPVTTGQFGARSSRIALGDSDTGIAQHGDGQLGLYANNTKMANINTNGMGVNIGDSSSVRARLQIDSGTGGGNVPNNKALLFGSDGSREVIFLSDSSGSGSDGIIGSWNTVYNHQNAKIVFTKPSGNTGLMEFHTQNGTGITERMRIRNDGHIGINSTSPDSLVTIDSGTTDEFGVKIRNDNIHGVIGCFGDGHTYERQFVINASRSDNGATGALRLAGQNHIRFCADLNGERMRLDNAGRLGINHVPSTSHEYLTVKPNGNNVLDIAYRLNSDTDIRHKYYDSSGTHRGGHAYTRYSNSTRYPNLHHDFYWTTNPSGTSTQVSMRLTREGYLLQQYIPAFGVAKTNDANQIGSGVYVFNQVHFNNGSHYSSSNGRFTAPKAGAYFFCFSLQLYGGNAVHARFQINGSDVFSGGTSSPIYEDGPDSHETLTHGMVLNLAQGDYVTVTRNAGTRGMQSSFCGHLLG